VHFAQVAANTLRGAFGYALREVAGSEFDAIFVPGATGPHPSGLADLPRPFVFRCAHLDGATFEPGQPVSFDVHVFDTRRPLTEIFVDAFRSMGQRGIGVGSGRMILEGVRHLDLQGRVIPGDPAGPLVLSLAPSTTPVEAIAVDFLTPIELKWQAQVASEPLFPILFARVRDRISTLRSLYGAGPLEIDFRAMGERACAVRMTASDIRFIDATRRSSRTGQRHPIGGFIGSATYQGPLAEFLPWLQAAFYTGVGRQTTWGKGAIRVTDLSGSPGV
jgi:hypothetical protein